MKNEMGIVGIAAAGTVLIVSGAYVGGKKLWGAVKDKIKNPFKKEELEEVEVVEEGEESAEATEE